MGRVGAREDLGAGLVQLWGMAVVDGLGRHHRDP
jgi:hypothetical protein